MLPSIRVRGLSKRYRLGEGPRAQYTTLRDRLAGSPRAAARRVWNFLHGRRGPDNRSDSLWALRDVSFDIGQGEVVGIVGCNGAGKSTLLKVLSRITEPTAGRAELTGTFGSLLEVGTGFHPELTGRENIYLNGAILGMSRRQIQKRFDDIVAFAELEQFLDTPVKRYSSGMYVRLAFAVSAHLEPDILVIDEVLAVGDLAFQRKCLEHTKRLRDSGGTVLLVSHNMFAIKATCDRAIYLSHGRLEYDGEIEEAIGRYEKDSQLSTLKWAESKLNSDPGAPRVRIEQIELLDDDGQPRHIFRRGDRLRIRVRYKPDRRLESLNVVVAFIRSDGVACCNHVTSLDHFVVPTSADSGLLEMRTPPLKLISELYQINIVVRDESLQRLYAAQQGPSFHVRDELLSSHFGVFHEPAEWQSLPIGNTALKPD